MAEVGDGVASVCTEMCRSSRNGMVKTCRVVGVGPHVTHKRGRFSSCAPSLLSSAILLPIERTASSDAHVSNFAVANTGRRVAGLC